VDGVAVAEKSRDVEWITDDTVEELMSHGANGAEYWVVIFADEEDDLGPHDLPLQLARTDEDWCPPDKELIIRYLRETPECLYQMTFPDACPLCDELVRSADQKSDGTWHWFSPLAHQVEKHYARLPDAMVAHIRSRNYTPTEST
jgi:hypothetical protein